MERRLTTILAADIAGFSRLVSVDEEGTLARRRAHRAGLVDPLLARHGGRIANTAGDSLLVEFPSSVEAVRFAIALQNGMAAREAGLPEDRRIVWRIGINAGDVVAEAEDLLGDGVNVAARLEALAPPGGILVSRPVRDSVRDRLDVALADLGPVEVRNIARPVRAFQVLRPGETPMRIAPARPWRLAVGGGVLALLAAGLAAAYAAGLFGGAGPVDRRPVLMVLPFDNLGGDAGQSYFSDGFTEDLTTDLSGVPGLMVVARNTAFAVRDRGIDIRTAGRELDVRYVVEGSARRTGDAVRINAQLIDVETGTHVWAERFDRPLSDIFIVQDELVDRIVGSVAAHLRRHEGEKALAASPETLEAYDLHLRARLLFRRNTPEAVGEARRLLREAVARDPDLAAAWATLARVENFFFTSRVSPEYARPETAARVLAAAEEAVARAPNDAYAHAVLGMALRLSRDYESAFAAARRARELAPNDADVLAEVASVLIGYGDYAGTVEVVETAWALDPYLSPVFIGAVLAQAQFALGDIAASRESARDCLRRSPRDVRCHESLARALGETGPPDAAARAVEALLALSPDYTVAEYRRRAEKNRRDRDAVDRWAAGLLKAGVPAE